MRANVSNICLRQQDQGSRGTLCVHQPYHTTMIGPRSLQGYRSSHISKMVLSIVEIGPLFMPWQPK